MWEGERYRYTVPRYHGTSDIAIVPWRYKFYRTSSEHGAQVRYVSSGGGASRSLPPPCGVPWMLAQRFFGCCDHQTSPLYHLDRVQN